MELVVVPIVPNNIKNIWVFQDDQQILEFIMNARIFNKKSINEQEEKIEESDELGILNLKTNSISKGMVALERIFDKDEHARERGKTLVVDGDDCELYNLGTQLEPREVRIGKVSTPEEKKQMVELFTKYKDVIAWCYEDLKTYDPNIIVHNIPLNPDAKAFCQRQRPVNPMIKLVIQREVQNFLDAKIIFPIRHSTWVTNLVPVRKKRGEVLLCVDFRNLNRSYQKDNYPLQSLEEVL